MGTGTRRSATARAFTTAAFTAAISTTAVVGPASGVAGQEAGGAAPDRAAAVGSAAAGARETTADRAGRDGAGRTDVPTLTALRADGELRVDGRLDEAAWQAAGVADGFVQQRPREGRPADQPTRVRVLIDGDALWVGARLADASPGDIGVRMGRRDEPVQADWFYVYFDSYDDRRTAFGFGVSAAGVQRDLRVTDDHVRDASWDAVWASAVTRDAEGWSAELRIPLSQLRFSAAGSGGDGWGLNFERQVARTNEVSHWAPVPQGVEAFVSAFGRLRGTEELVPSRRIEVVPYTVVRETRADVDPADPFAHSTDRFGTVGADLRVGLGSLTLSATLNPDFGQVEADPAELNLTAFETFQRERRPFFVEGADLFELAFPRWPPVFYSRRIGRAPQGSLPAGTAFADRPASTTILGAVKLSGKTADGWSVGVLDALTPDERAPWIDTAGVRSSSVVEPLTNHAVVRVARELRGGRSSLGVLATSTVRRLEGTGLGFLHESAWTGGIDGHHRFAGEAWEARFGMLGSHVRGSPEAIRRTQRAPGHWFQRPDAGHLDYDPTRTSLSGYSLQASVRKIRGAWKVGANAELDSPGYEISDLGFNPSLDQRRGGLSVRYEDWTPGRVFRSWNAGSWIQVQTDFSGRIEELTQDFGFHFELLDYWGGGIWLMRHQPSWAPDALRGGPALRRPGRWMGSFNARSDTRRELSGSGFLFWEAEDETDGMRLNLSLDVTWRPSDRLRVTAGPSLGLAREAWQYVGRTEVAGDPRYVVSGMDRRTVSVGTRLDYTASPTLSFQLYARPFVATAEYDAFREVVEPTAERFEERFLEYAVSREERVGADRLLLDRDGDGTPEAALGDPSLALAAMQVNAVLRWEYRPGSTLYAVWTHDRDALGRDRFGVDRGLDLLRDAPGRHVFMVKASWWLGL